MAGRLQVAAGIPATAGCDRGVGPMAAALEELNVRLRGLDGTPSSTKPEHLALG